MKFTGYQLREAIRRWHNKLEVSASLFNDALWVFEDDITTSPNPKEIGTVYLEAEEAVALLETAQQSYNLAVKFPLLNYGEVTLAFAVKLIGTSGRYAKMWKGCASDTGKEKYGYNRDKVKSADDIFAKRTIGISDAMEIYNIADRRASQIRAIIAVANSTEIEIEDNEDLARFLE